MAEKLGIAFSGGGGKGAYQIGVWKALRELGIEQFISVAAGTSVGGLNTALFMQGDAELAESAWTNLSQMDVLSSFNNPSAITDLISNPKHSLPKSIISFINEGIFSNEGLERLIDNNLNLDMVSNAEIPGYVTCCCKDDVSHIRYIKLNGLENQMIKKLLLATSAIPLVFPSVEIDGTEYYDGGTRGSIFGSGANEGYDSIPLLPLIEEGCTKAIVVHQSASTIIRKEEFPNLQLIEIFPSQRLGGLFTGMLDFSAEGARKRLDLGYQDAKAIFEPWIESVATLTRIGECFNSIISDSNFDDLKEKMKEGEYLRDLYRNKYNNTTK
jgi:NTE family protein